ncbi:6-phosphogluconate dehydrogenase-like protein [Williamsia muralis]|uniref:6-phosphogluconate dehydrogenase-like protein n=1 Tax=Williamsia marianensis TaxID=85044 RepID=A0A495KA87_WILMA|nr:NAD(P)-binding domain-containing protein [Williamsia muralis]RKR97474.1 6-phosphogluconate dehydrogenase-like protein [Williamsia muralis]
MSAPDTPDDTTSNQTPRVAVLGTGLMGSAIARSLLNNDYPVSVWNRTPGRCDPLRELGARTVTTSTEAIRDNDVIILMVLDYTAARTLLMDAADHLQGKTIANLVTGSAAEAEDLSAWVSGQGADYLDGIIAAYPGDIGKPSTLFYYAGNVAAWSRYKTLLTALAGAATYVGSKPSAANILDAAMTATFHTVSIGAFLEGMSYARSAGVDLSEIKRTLPYWLDLLSQEINVALDSIQADSHTTDQATLETYLVALRTINKAMVGDGERANLLGAAVDNLERAHAAGHGQEALSAQILTAKANT